jgi:hypothetical protein
MKLLLGSKKALNWKRKRVIRRHLQANKYKRFYQTRLKMAMPEMAFFFLDIVTGVSQFKKGLLFAGKSNRLRSAVFEYHLDEQGTELLESISPDNIKKDSSECDTVELTKRTQQTMTLITKKFDAAWFKKTDDVYNQIVLFSWFVTFDYAALLEKFGNIAASKFQKVNAANIVENIKDFLTVTEIFMVDADWKTIFKILAIANGAPSDIDQWFDLKRSVVKVLKSEILAFVVQHADNADWESYPLKSSIRYAKEFLDTFTKNAQKTLDGIVAKSERKKIDVLVGEVFNAEKLHAAQYYTDEDREEYTERGYTGFTKTETFSYLLAFFNTYFGQLKILTDTLVVKGFWANRDFSLELSATMRDLNEAFHKISGFDKSLSEYGERGAKLKSLLSKTAWKKGKNEAMQKRLDIVNTEAETLINQAVERWHSLNGSLKTLKADSEERSLLHNWKEIGDILRKEDMGIGAFIQKIDAFMALLEFVNPGLL